ncbi:hypothetical protein HG531_012622 [Fusarium graminearum]|nr:hypothetical protein HG531_012622 [Fusarium graminearum]
MFDGSLKKLVAAIVNIHFLQLLDQPGKAHVDTDCLMFKKGARVGCVSCDVAEDVKCVILELKEPLISCSHVFKDFDHLTVKNESQWFGCSVANAELPSILAFKFHHGLLSNAEHLALKPGVE